MPESKEPMAETKAPTLEMNMPKTELPFVEKPTFTVGHLQREGLEVKSFDPVTTACYLQDWQVDECCAQFFGWRYDQRESKYTDDKGRERSMYWEAWLNPKGKGTYRFGLDEIKPPPFRSRKWGEILAYCVEQGWEPEIVVRQDPTGKSLHACLLKPCANAPACEHKGEAICKSFLAAAWTLQEAKQAQESRQEEEQMAQALAVLGPTRDLTAKEIQDARELDITGVEELLKEGGQDA